MAMLNAILLQEERVPKVGAGVAKRGWYGP